MDTNRLPQPTGLLQAGQEALARGAWEEARSAFERTLSTSAAIGQSSRDELPAGADAEILSGLAEALWWLGEIRRALDCWERAYLGFRQGPDPAQATLIAIQLSLLYQANLGNRAAASGWVARASRLVDEHEIKPLRGWVFIAGAVDAPDPGQHEAWARTAHELGQASGDRDLELCALTQIGVAPIDQGRIAEGTTFHDEAMAGALAGEGALETVVFTSCEMMTSYSRCAQYQRMDEWIRAAERFVERYGCPYLDANCRSHYGEVLFASAEWARAEEELRAAIRLSENSLPAVQARTLAKLAGPRLAQGRADDAERLLAGFEDHEATVPVFARIHLLRGEPILAAATVGRRLDAIGENRLESALLLELLGEAEICQDQIDAAAKRGRKLAELGGTFKCRVMVAHGERLRGHALAIAEDAAAKRHLALNLMARAFPNSTFVGYDLSEEGIVTARAKAEALGLENASFEVRDAETLDDHDRYQLITAFDVIHDLAHPAEVLGNIYRALEPGGTFLMVDPAASSHLHENHEHPMGPFLYTVSTMHCMTVSLAQGGVGLGTAWGEQSARRMLAEVGFSEVEVEQIEGDIFNSYFIATKG